jgi:dienelactone hydrolase
LVVFSHGLSALPRYFAPLMQRWASAGFVVVAPTYPHTRAGATDPRLGDVAQQPADASAVITEVLRPGILRAQVDDERIAAAGHSAGGITTVLMFTSQRDPRLVAGVVLAGTVVNDDPFVGPPAWLLFVHGTTDLLVPYAGGRMAYRADPWPKSFLTLDGRGHVEPYLTPGTESYEVVADTTVDFLRLALYGDHAAGQRMPRDVGPVGNLDSSLPTSLS